MLDSETISRHQKARIYTEQPERFHVRSLVAEFDGLHHQHDVRYGDGHWSCDCDHFRRNRTCPHTMAAQRMVGGVAPEVQES